MKGVTMKSIALIVLMLSGAACAQPCGPQAFRHLDDVDPNMVADDPVSGQKLLVQLVRAKVGDTVMIWGHACDDDGDPLLAWADDPNMPIAIDPNDGTFTFNVQRNTPGIEYITIGLSDGTVLRKGTYAVDFRANTPPVLSAFPPVGGIDVARLKQKALQILAKAFGRPTTSALVVR
jgi:hypothetical protein